MASMLPATVYGSRRRGGRSVASTEASSVFTKLDTSTRGRHAASTVGVTWLSPSAAPCSKDTQTCFIFVLKKTPSGTTKVREWISRRQIAGLGRKMRDKQVDR